MYITVIDNNHKQVDVTNNVISVVEILTGPIGATGTLPTSGSWDFTGSINVSGSVNANRFSGSFFGNGNGIFTGTFSGSATTTLQQTTDNGNSTTNSITSSGGFFGTASYASNSDLLDGKDSTTFNTTSSFNNFTSSYSTDSASFDSRILNVSSSVTLLSSQTSSYVLNSQTSSMSVLSASYSSTSSYVLLAQSSSYLTGSQSTLLINNSSTGIISFGGLSINTDTTKFDVGVVKGWFIDNFTNPTNPTYLYKEFQSQSALTTTFISSSTVTYVGINSLGSIQQSLTKFDPTQHHNVIPLGILVHINLSVITSVTSMPNITNDVALQLRDLTYGLHIFNVDGNVHSPNGVNLKIDKSSGNLFRYGANYINQPQNPHIVPLSASLQTVFQYRLSNGGIIGGNLTDINPNIYENPLGFTSSLAPNKFTIQRIYNLSEGITRIQLGQNFYVNMSTAIDALGHGTDTFTEDTDFTNNGLLRCYLIVKQGTTDLSNTSDALFLIAPKFPGGAGVGGLSVSSLQKAYDNSINPEILTNSTLGAVSIRRGSTADTDNVLEILNISSSIKASITGEGSIYASGGFTGSLLGTSTTASYVYLAQSASYYGGSVVSASYALTASYSLNGGGGGTTTGSFTGSFTGSLQGSASYALTASYAINSAGGGPGYWATVAGTPVRVGNTSFTITDTTNANLYDLLYSRTTVLKWTDTGVTKLGMVVSAVYAANAVTITIVGDTLTATATMSTFTYSHEKCVPKVFAIAGTIATGTDLTGKYKAPCAMKVFGADGLHGTAGTTNATTYDINKNGTTMFTAKLSIASAATVGDGFTANDSTTLDLDDIISVDCDSVSTTAPVDVYIYLFTFPLNNIYLT